MQYLEFEVKNMALSRLGTDKVQPISGSVNYFGVHFTFDEAFAAIPGTKSVEFYKGKRTIRKVLVDNACAIPKEMLTDKTPIEIRVICGETVGTAWQSITVTESGTIMPDEPDEELPETMSYIKTPTGDGTVAMFRKGESGLEFSQNGEDWEGGVNGIPEVPKTPKDAAYLRKNGDWVLHEEPKTSELLAGTASVIAELDSGAELADVIAKVNEIVGALKARGVTA